MKKFRKMFIYIFYVFVLIQSSDVQAQEVPLTLEKMLALTIEKQSDIQLGRLSIDAAKGANLSAASPFDIRLNAAAKVKSVQTPLSPYKESVYGVSKEKSDQRELTLAASKTLRSGVTLSTELASAYASDKTYNTPDEDSRKLGLSLSVPFYDITDGNVYGLREKAAQKDTRSAVYAYYHRITSGVYSTMQIWWNYVAAYETMMVYKSAEKSMNQYLLDYRKLVEGGERPQADLNQLEAKYRYTRMEANGAESSFVSAGYSLCGAVGISGVQCSYSLPDTSRPDLDSLINIFSKPADSSGISRFDIRSAEIALEGRQLIIDALKREKKPEIGLSLSYLQADTEGNSGATLVTALDFSMPVEKSAANGALMQEMAAYGQGRVLLNELRRSAEIDTANAVSELVFAHESLKMAEETVRLYSKAYETEKRKQSLGMSTVLDVVNTADSHRDALLQKIEYARQASAAAAKLAYVSGRIIKVEKETASVNPEFLP